MKRSRSRGFALVLVLGLVVLITVVIVALFSHAQLQLQSTTAGTAGVTVDLLAQNAADLIVSDLRGEMLAGSDYTNKTGTHLVMRPATNLSMVPSRVVATSLQADGNFVNLLKQSLHGQPDYSNVSGAYPQSAQFAPHLRAVDCSSSSRSKNGRIVLPSRWNDSRLVMGAGFSATNQVPDWIMMSRGGILDGSTAWKANFTKNTPENPDLIVGRFAYNIYAIGGLLDANAVGFSGSLSAADLKKLAGTLAGIDPAKLSGAPFSAANRDDLATWRNPASDYPGYIQNTALTNGFLDPHTGLNRVFASRRDLIKFSEDHAFTNALPYLTHFTREKNCPSASPSFNAVDRGGTNGVGNIYAYRDNATAASSLNPLAPNIHGQTAGTILAYHDDGTSFTYDVTMGEPLLQRRFSLGKLKWIAHDGPNGASAAAVLACFGLQWDAAGAQWKYVAADASDAIKTLDQVASEGREPNFFEFLQAGILRGSLGRDNEGYVVSGAPDPAMPYQFQANRTLQILTIGANIIDQADADSFPTVISAPLSGSNVRLCGSESLPSLSSYKEIAGASAETPSAHALYLVAALWNPYREEVSPTTAATPNVRIRLRGGYQQDCAWSPAAGSAAALFAVRVGTVDASVQLNKAQYGVFSVPTPLTTATASGVSGNNASGGSWQTLPTIPGVSPNLVGMRYPDVTVDATRETTVQNACTARGDLRPQYLVVTEGLASDPYSVTMEFEQAAGVWIPYSISSGLEDPATWKYGKVTWAGGSRVRPDPAAVEKPNAWLDSGSDPQLRTGTHRYKADPRSTRFNEITYAGGYPDSTPYWLQPINRVESSPSLAQQNTPSLFSQPDNANATWSPASLAFNNTTLVSDSYSDPDGVKRLADYGRFGSKTWTNTAFEGANRPVILNRPFNSVSELSLAFRDLPWKSLDFSTGKSGDAALLDLFSLADEPAVRAGVLDLNSRNTAVLAAVTDDPALAASITSYTSTNALCSRADLALLGDTQFTGNIKPTREANLLHLAELGQVRTWNLLVDLVVQNVRYPSTATGFDQAIVSGERHYWFSVALDRFTGEIVDQSMELVYDY